MKNNEDLLLEFYLACLGSGKEPDQAILNAKEALVVWKKEMHTAGGMMNEDGFR